MKSLFTSTRKAVSALLLLVGLCAVSVAQGPANYPPTWVYARAYNWNLVGPTGTNNFIFNGAGACQYSPLNNGQPANSIFDFSGSQGASTVYNPVFILDANPALNEVVTPTSTTNTQTQCSFSASPANSHISFTLYSGTGGLQEAITNQLQNTPAFVVVLDKYWYQLISGMPTTTTPQSIISAATGTANVYIVDTTTAPWTYYTWNGSKYVPDASTYGIPFTSLTAIAVPVAPTTVTATCGTNGGGCITTATTGGTIPASGAYTVGYTYVTALGGETTLSTDTAGGATVTTGSGTATNTITITSPAAETGAVGWRPYLTAASGASLSEILYASSCVSASTGQIVLNGVCAIGSSAVITAIITGTATVPTVSSAFPVASGSTSPAQALVSYPPFSVVGASLAAASTTTLGVVNYPTGFLNTLGRSIRMCGTGIAAVSSTASGTLTLATTLASVAGVTSVTPFTVVSGTITGTSQTINFNFCETWTTTVVGSSGKVEAHGWVGYNLAGTTAVSTIGQDIIHASSSAVDLTKQDQIAFTLTPATNALAAGGAQLRTLTVEVLQ